MALSDYSQADLAAVAKSLGALRGNEIDYSKLSEAALQSLIGRTANGISLNDGHAASHTGGAQQIDPNAPADKSAGPRDAAKANLKSVLDGDAQDIILTQHLLLANGFNITLDRTLDDYEIRSAEKLYTAYHKGMAASEINKVAAQTNTENSEIAIDRAEAQAAEVAATANAEQQIISAKAGLVKLGYLPADTVLDTQWTGQANDAFYYMQRDFSMSLQAPDSEAASRYGSLRDQQEAVFGTSYGADDSKWQVQNSEALVTIVGQVVSSAHPDIRHDLTGTDPQAIKLAQGVLALNDKDVKITGTIDHETATAANEYMAAGHNGIPAYLLNGREGVHFDNAQIDRAAKIGNLPMPTNGLSELDLQTFNELGGRNTPEGRLYYADIIKQSGEEFYTKLLANEAKQEPIPVPEKVATTPALMQIDADESRPEVLQSVNIFTALPNNVVDGMPEEVAALVLAKQNLVKAQEYLGDDVKNGIFKVGGIQPDGTYYDRALALTELRSAEDSYMRLEELYRKDEIKLATVENYLREQGTVSPTNDTAPDNRPIIVPDQPAADVPVADATANQPGFFEKWFGMGANAGETPQLTDSFGKADKPAPAPAISEQDEAYKHNMRLGF